MGGVRVTVIVVMATEGPLMAEEVALYLQRPASSYLIRAVDCHMRPNESTHNLHVNLAWRSIGLTWLPSLWQ